MTQDSVLPPNFRIARTIPQDGDSSRPLYHLSIPKHNGHLSHTKADPHNWHNYCTTSKADNWHFTTQLTQLNTWSKPANVLAFIPRNQGLVTFFGFSWHCRTWRPCWYGTFVMNQLKAIIIGNNQSKTSCNAGKLLLDLLPRNRQHEREDVFGLLFLHQIPE